MACLRGRGLGTGEWSLGMEGGLSVLAGALESGGAGGGARDPSASDSLFCSVQATSRTGPTPARIPGLRLPDLASPDTTTWQQIVRAMG